VVAGNWGVRGGGGGGTWIDIKVNKLKRCKVVLLEKEESKY